MKILRKAKITKIKGTPRNEGTVKSARPNHNSLVLMNSKRCYTIHNYYINRLTIQYFNIFTYGTIILTVWDFEFIRIGTAEQSILDLSSRGKQNRNNRQIFFLR